MFNFNCGHVCQLSGIMAIDFWKKKKKIPWASDIGGFPAVLPCGFIWLSQFETFGAIEIQKKCHKTVLMKFLGEIIWSIQTKSPIPLSNQTETPSTSGFCLWCGWVPSTFTPASNNSAVVTGVYRLPLWSAVMKTQHPGGHTRDTGLLIHIHLSPFKQCSNIFQSVLV